MLILLTLQESADLIGHHLSHVRLLVKQKKFPKPIKTPGRAVRIHFAQDDVFQWLVKRERKLAVDAAKGHKRRGAPVRPQPTDGRHGWPSIASRTASVISPSGERIAADGVEV